MIKGILFDVDGVLIDSEDFLKQAYCLEFEKLGVKVQDGDFSSCVGTKDENTILTVAGIHNLTIEDASAVKCDIYTTYSKLIKGVLKPFPGVFDFIEKVRAAGLKLAVATSGEKRKLGFSFSEINLPFETFDAIISADMVERTKPDPDIYRKAAKGLNLANDECLVIEDAVSGIVSGRGAGSLCLGVTSSFSKEELYEAGADAVIKDLTEFPPFSDFESFNRAVESLMIRK